MWTTPPLAARPETHQNLIHPDKDHSVVPRMGDANSAGRMVLANAHSQADYLLFSVTQTADRSTNPLNTRP